jgi:cytochrome P450
VLDSAAARHRLADRFVLAVRRATQNGDASGWDGINAMFEEIMLSVVFGHGQRERALSALQQRLMRQANRVIALGPSKQQAQQAADIRAALLASNPDGLVGLADLPFDNHAVQAENQVPHWMFAIRDTLAANSARALALLTSHREALERAREELDGCDLDNPEHIGRLRYIEGALQEAMRLWPTTPILARESLRRDALGDDEIAARTPIVIFNQYLHRDPDAVDDANQFKPERWAERRSDPQFNHMSNGPQVCAGKNLALFLGTAVLANLIDQGHTLKAPSLDPSMPIPATFNYFRLRFARSGT